MVLAGESMPMLPGEPHGKMCARRTNKKRILYNFQVVRRRRPVTVCITIWGDLVDIVAEADANIVVCHCTFMHALHAATSEMGDPPEEPRATNEVAASRSLNDRPRG